MSGLSESKEAKTVTLTSEELSRNNYEKAAELINTKVDESCPLGSTNKGVGPENDKHFSNLSEAIHFIFSTENSTIKSIISLRKEFRLLRVHTFIASSLSRYFKKKPFQQVVYLPLEQITDPKHGFLELAQAVQCTLLKWPKKILGGLAPYFGMYQYDMSVLNTLLKNTLSENTKCFEAEQRYNAMIITGVKKDDSKQKREFFFSEMMNSFRKIAVTYGWGNCGHMADGAFLEAIYLGIPCIYVRFTSLADKSVEELNAIVLGEELKPGCRVAVPWNDGKEKSLIWQGFKKTPELSKHKYDTVKIIFGVKKPEEILKFKQILVDNEYPSWLQDPTRIRNIAFIQKCFDNFKLALAEFGFLKDAEKEFDAKEAKDAPQLVAPTPLKTVVSGELPKSDALAAQSVAAPF